MDADDVVRETLGPSPEELLRHLAAVTAAGDVQAVAVVTQDRNGGLVLYSGGCTVLETVGMLAWGETRAVSALSPDVAEEDA